MIVPLLWLAVRRSGHAAVNALAWPGLGLRDRAACCSPTRAARCSRRRSGSCCGWRSSRCGCATRRRARRRAGGHRAARRLGVRAGRADARQPAAAAARRRRAGARRAAAAAARRAARSRASASASSRDSPPAGRAHAARAPRACWSARSWSSPRSRSCCSPTRRAASRARYRRRGSRRPTRPPHTPANTPGAADRDVLGALALLARGARRPRREPVARRRRRRVRHAAAALPRPTRCRVRHAHGYVVQTLADLGWVGLGGLAARAVRLAVGGVRARSACADAIAGCRGTRERVGDGRRWPSTVVVFGVHSAIDWTWFVPGNVVPALLCAGWVVARGPLRERLAPLRAEPEREALPTVSPLLAGGLVAVIALVGAWSALQPVRSVHAENAAYARLDAGPAAAGDLDRRDRARARPAGARSAVRHRLVPAGARATRRRRATALEQAVDLEPANPEPWRRLGAFRLTCCTTPRARWQAYQAAYFLDPQLARRASRT